MSQGVYNLENPEETWKLRECNFTLGNSGNMGNLMKNPGF